MRKVSKKRNTDNILFVIRYVINIKIYTAVTITEPSPKALKKLVYEQPREITAATNFETELEQLDSLGKYNLYYLLNLLIII